ncbi:MAG TPA: AI-2E family transporter [Ktedonobacterales bacterium]|jgi:predicted PurR-regulated permease PerM|nr:AI-2E family transporter [Ktedonobacterales bacterium]
MDSTQRVSGEAAPADDASTRRRFSITITPRTLWLAAGILVAVLVGIVLITQAAGTLIALLLAIILGEAIRPLVVRLQRYRIPGPLAVLLIYVVALVVVGFLLWLLLNPLVQEVNSLINNLPSYLDQLQRQANNLGRQLRAQGALSQFINALSHSLASVAQQAIPRLITVPVGLLTGVFGLFINLVVVLTMTLFWLMASERLKPFVVSLFPKDSQDQASGVLTEIGRGFGGYIRGTLISMVLIGSLSAAGLALLGVPYALLLGILAGLTELLPYLGPWISGTVAVLVALITVDPVKALEVIVLFLLIQEIEGNVVEPLVMSRAVNVDPLLVIVSVLIGIDLLGIIGAILAVPIAAAAQILVVRVLAPAIRHTAGAPAAPAVMASEPAEPSTPPLLGAPDRPLAGT